MGTGAIVFFCAECGKGQYVQGDLRGCPCVVLCTGWKMNKSSLQQTCCVYGDKSPAVYMREGRASPGHNRQWECRVAERGGSVYVQRIYKKMCRIFNSLYSEFLHSVGRFLCARLPSCRRNFVVHVVYHCLCTAIPLWLEWEWQGFGCFFLFTGVHQTSVWY